MTTSNLKRPRSLRVAHTAPSTPFARTTLAIGASTALLLPAFAAAQEVVEVKPVSVTVRAPDHNPHGEPGAAYKAKTSGDERRVKPLAETPATITVLTQQQLLDTGRTDLREILRTQPGITLGTGENGNAFGDRYIIRGQEARSDVFVDGLRDPGMTVRESFATEQVEITKGPSATFAGRGATGGAVNSITKQATTDADFTKLSAGVGTDDFYRLTLDANHAFSDDTALRVNLLKAYQEVPDRGPADRERQGVALSLHHKLTDKLNVTADYYHMGGEDKPDLGSWMVGSPAAAAKVVKNPPVYVQDTDYLRSNIDTYTVRVNYQHDDDTKVSNLTRYGTTTNRYLVTGGRNSTFVNADGDKALAQLSNHAGGQDVSYFANQTNLFLNRDIAGMKHNMIFSLELSDHNVRNGQFTVTPLAGISPNCGSNYCVFEDGQGDAYLRQATRTGTRSLWQNKTIGLSAMDAVDVTDKWTVFGGVRIDRIDYSNDNGGLRYSLQDNLTNYQLGTTYKFLPHANVYVNYSTGSDFNGGESDVTSCGYGGLCLPGGTTPDDKLDYFSNFSSPEKSENIELGTKWELMGGKLLATAAVFRVTKSDVMEQATPDNYSQEGALNTGKYRVQGYELGLSGNITSKLSAHAGYARLDAEQLESLTAANVGKDMANVARHSASVLLSYKLTPKFAFGGTYTYQSSKFAGSPESVSNGRKLPGYGLVDLFASYKFNRNLSARVNIGNVLDKEHYTAAYTSGTFAYLGDARNVRATLNYDF